MLFSFKVNMNRPRRKSVAATKPIVDSSTESDDCGKVGAKSKKRKKDKTDSRFRMKTQDDDIFVQLCVDNFHEINNTATLRGSFVLKKQIETKKVWDKITSECNKIFKVSKFKFIFIHSIKRVTNIPHAHI